MNESALAMVAAAQPRLSAGMLRTWEMIGQLGLQALHPTRLRKGCGDGRLKFQLGQRHMMTDISVCGAGPLCPQSCPGLLHHQ